MCQAPLDPILPVAPAWPPVPQFKGIRRLTDHVQSRWGTREGRVCPFPTLSPHASLALGPRPRALWQEEPRAPIYLFGGAKEVEELLGSAISS